LAEGGTIEAISDIALAPISLRETVNSLCAIGMERGGGIYQASSASDITYLDAAHHIADVLNVNRRRVKE